MPNRFKKLVVTFLTIFIAGSVFLPSISFAQTDSTATTTEQNPTNQVLTQTGSGFSESLPNLPICNITGAGDGTFEGCFVRLFYYAILYPSAWIASIAGQIFDYFVAYTLNSESYHSGGFVESGWRIVRDLINASFIFILLYVAIRFIINAQSSGISRILPRILILAVVINFSLFATRAIIDAGNILARVFYEKIVVENDVGAETTHYTTLSAGLIGKVNPQKLLSADTFRVRHEATGIDSSIEQNTLGTLNNVDNEALGQGFQVGAGFMILIILLASAVNIALAWVFFSVSLSLVGRTLGLWIMMIMSPVAFASASIPFLKVKDYGFNDWIQKTAQLSFMAVLFMFFLYLTIMFLDVANSTILNVAFESQNMSTVHLIMAVVVPCIAVLYLLKIAQNQAKSMSGEFGSMVGTALKWGTVAALGAGGLALGATAGAGAALGRQTLGRGGAALARSANTSTAFGRAQRRLGNRMSRANYDARNVNIPQPIQSATRTLRSGLSYATGGAVGAGDLRMTNLNRLGSPDSRGYTQRREEHMRRTVDRAREFRVDENTTVTTAPTSYTHVDTNGNRSTRVVNSTNISAPEAQAQVEARERALNEARERAHRDNDYESKKQELADKQKEHEKEIEKQKKALDAKEKRYKELVAERQAGNLSIKEADITQARKDRDDQKVIHDTEIARTKSDVDAAKKKVDDVEVLYRDNENELEEARATSAAAARALSNQNAQVLNNYADSVDTWAPFPDAGLTHRYGANRDAAAEIRSTANRERR